MTSQALEVRVENITNRLALDQLWVTNDEDIRIAVSWLKTFVKKNVIIFSIW